MGNYSIDISHATAKDKVYCTQWTPVLVRFPKGLTEEQVENLMEKHPLLLEVLEEDTGCGDIDVVAGDYTGVALGLTSDRIPFSDFDENHEFDYRDFDNYKSDAGWDGWDKTIQVEGHDFHISVTDAEPYININVWEN
jgi:hypothetical protein